MTDELGVDDLVDALARRLRWADAHQGLYSYWARRFEVLSIALSVEPGAIDGTTGDETDVVRSVLCGAATALVEPPNPFRGILEGGELIVPIYQSVSPALQELARMNAAVNLQVARSCLRVLAPGIDQRTCSHQVLIDAGLDIDPDPDLYW